MVANRDRLGVPNHGTGHHRAQLAPDLPRICDRRTRTHSPPGSPTSASDAASHASTTAALARIESSKVAANSQPSWAAFPHTRHILCREGVVGCLGAAVVVKQDGLAAGKGVVVPETDEETTGDQR